MKKLKILLSVVSVLLVMLLSSCVESKPHEHDFQMKSDNLYHYLECECGEIKDSEKHNYIWVDSDNRGAVRKECIGCGRILNQDELYIDPIVVNSSPSGANAVMPLIPYEIKVDSRRFDYNEEFTISLTLRVGRYYCKYIAEGPFYVKLEDSPYYDIIGENEYITPDFSSSEDIKTLSLDFKFTVKATNPTSVIEQFKFKIKFTPHDSFWEEASMWSRSEHYFYCDTDEEYFFTVSALNFMSDSQGIIMGSWNPRLFYDSINREYLSGSIESYDDYVTRIFECITENKPHLNMSSADNYNRNKGFYVSKNVKADFYLEESFDSVYEKYSSESQRDKKEAAKELMAILYSNNLIDSNQYEREIEYIDDNGVLTHGAVVAYNAIDYDEIINPDLFKDHIVRYVYDEAAVDESNGNSCPTEPDANSANLYLEEYIVPVGTDIDVAVYTTLSREVEGYVTHVQDGFELSSNIEFIDEVIRFSLTYNGQNDRPRFDLEVCLSGDDIEFIIDIYG